jgi:hypothetical protein
MNSEGADDMGNLTIDQLIAALQWERNNIGGNVKVVSKTGEFESDIDRFDIYSHVTGHTVVVDKGEIYLILESGSKAFHR